jgi:hypothetical protein
MDAALHLEKKIQNRLNELDLNLFLDKDVIGNTLYYSVKILHKVGDEPNQILLWADPLGRPLPLSEEIITNVRAQEGDIRDAIAQVKANNAAIKELHRQKRHQETDERAKEMEKSAKILHRSGPWAPKHDVTGWSNK